MHNLGEQKSFTRCLTMLLLFIGIFLLDLEGEVNQAEKAVPVWSLAATGDSIITRRISVYEDPLFMEWVKITRDADVAFTNLECQVFRFSEFKGFPAAQNGGGYERGEPEVAEDLKWAGFDLISRANNHTGDWGIEGMLETNRILDDLGLVHAGTGMNLGQASQAKYLETKKGRFALIGFASTFTQASPAGAVRPEVQGRPGLNPLRIERKYQLTQERMNDLKGIMAAFGAKPPDSLDVPVRFPGITFVQGSENKSIQTANSTDVDRILRNIKSASKQADYVVVSGHCHESGKTDDDPPEFLVDLARKSIDAGATIFIVHGPHRVGGIEIYKDKPIFYSLGDFIFQYETTEPQAADIYDEFGVKDKEATIGDFYDPENQGDAYSLLNTNTHWWEGVLAVPTFRGHKLIDLKLYPLELGHKAHALSGDGRAQRGTPRIAEGELAKKIIDLITRTSEVFGTQIAYQDGVGILIKNL